MTLTANKAHKKKPSPPPEHIINKRISNVYFPWKKRSTAQSSIPYDVLYEDGIAYLGNHQYSITYNFDDINYTNTDDQTRTAAFEDYCYLINSFDDTIGIQMHIVNMQLARTAVNVLVSCPQNSSEHLETVVNDLNNTANQRLTGSDSYIKKKYITLTILENSYEAAQQRFNRIDSDILSQLRSMGCATHKLNKYGRLVLLREYYRPDDLSPISREETLRNGIYDKDLIAPFGIDKVPGDRYIKLGDDYVQCLFFSAFPHDLSDELIHDLTDKVDRDMFITINIQPTDPDIAIKDVEKKLKRLDTEKYNIIARQCKAGIPIPEIPRELEGEIKNTTRFLEDLRTRNEKMFMANVLIMVRGKTKDEVDLIAEEVMSPAKKHGCTIHPFTFDHENALNSIVPLGRNDTFVKRSFKTTSIAVFTPFNVTEIVQPTGFCYGKNALSHNILMLDRKTLMNPHGFYFGASGSGKSMGAKLEIIECFLRTHDDMIIIDPDGEFTKVVELLGGQVIKVSNGSQTNFNPFDINEYYGGEEEPDPIPFKSDFIISLLEITLNYRYGIDAITRSVIDHCVREIYAKYIRHPCKANIPTFQDFYEVLGNQDKPEAKALKGALEIYVEGSLNIFAKKTNIDINNRLVCFNTRDLGKQLKLMGMSIIQDWCWNHISENQAKLKTTWLWNDEIHHSLRNANTGSWLIDSWKRGRKYGLIATGMTQEVRDVLKNEDSKSLLSNSEFIMLYRQKPDMIEDLAQVMDLSGRQVKKLQHSDSGCGLFKAGNSIVEFDNRYPDDTELFKVVMSDVNKRRREGT